MWHSALERWPSRMSACRSLGLRLRTAAMKLAKWLELPENLLISTPCLSTALALE